MTQEVKPKQCGENNWYIPNQKGFVPKIGEHYWVVDEDLQCRKLRHGGNFCDYALIDQKNCFEAEQEALAAFVKPIDPTPVNWDEFCEIVNAGGDLHSLTVSKDGFIAFHNVKYFPSNGLNALSRINFEAGIKLWRSEESMQAWLDKFSNDS